MTRLGIDQLLETLLTVAELHEYKANPDRPARGTCLESEIHEDRGVVAKLLVQSGTLRTGDVLVCGPAYGRVKAMYDTLATQERHAEAGPSTPVNVTGLSVAPGAGDRFHVLEGIAQARQLARRRAEAARRKELSGGRGPRHPGEPLRAAGPARRGADAEHYLAGRRPRLDRGHPQGDGKLEHPEVQIRILQATVGGVTEADVHLADASDAVIIGFNVVADEGARGLAEARGVQIRRYDIIYQVTEDLKAALEGMLRPAKQERDLGRALVQQVFHISRVGSVAGCRVLSGVLQRDARVRVIRDNQVLGDYAMESLRREKDDAREVREGLECGVHAGRLQRHQGRRRPGGLQDRGDQANAGRHGLRLALRRLIGQQNSMQMTKSQIPITNEHRQPMTDGRGLLGHWCLVIGRFSPDAGPTYAPSASAVQKHEFAQIVG